METLNPDILTGQEARLRRLARAIVGDSYADDVVQDALAAAWAQRATPPANWGGWLSRVTRSLAWKRRIRDERRGAREVEALMLSTRAPLRRPSSAPLDAPAAPSAAGGGAPSDADLGSMSQPPDAIAVELEEKHALERALLALDEPYRSTVYWRYYEGLSIEQISRRSGHPQSTTRTHLQRGLGMLRERLKSAAGPDWRAALIPLLRPKREVAAVSYAAACAGGLVTMTLVKLTGLAAATLCAVLLGLNAMSGAPSAAPPLFARTASTDLAEPAGAPRPTAPLPRVELSASEPEPPAAPAAAEPAAADPAPADPPSLPALLLDPRSGLPVPFTTLELTLNRRKRGLFGRPSPPIEVTVTTAEDGSFVIPFERSTLRTGNGGVLLQGRIAGSTSGIECRFEGLGLPPEDPDDEAPIRTLIDHCALLWVRLPAGVDEAGLSTFTVVAGMSDPRSGTGMYGEPFQPLARRGQDLLIGLMDYTVATASPGTGWVLRITEHARGTVADSSPATRDAARGATFEARAPKTHSLADPAILAEPFAHGSRTFRVVDARTQEPVPRATVRISLPARRAGERGELVSGISGENGEATLHGIAEDAGAASELKVMAEGFGTYTDSFTLGFSAGGPAEATEIGLTRKGRLRTIEVRVRGPEGPAPNVLFAYVSSAKTSGATEPESTIRPTIAQWDGPTSTDAWERTFTIEGAPDGDVKVRLQPPDSRFAAVGEVVVPLSVDFVEFELGAPRLTAQLQLVLEEGVQHATFYRGAEVDRGAAPPKQRGGLAGRSAVGEIVLSPPKGNEPDESRWNWVATAPGYVPAFGTERDVIIEERGVFDRESGKSQTLRSWALRPELRAGQGFVVQAYTLDADPEFPRYGQKRTPAVGAEIVSVADGRIVAVTDERGFAVVEYTGEAPKLMLHHGHHRHQVHVPDDDFTSAGIDRRRPASEKD